MVVLFEGGVLPPEPPCHLCKLRVLGSRCSAHASRRFLVHAAPGCNGVSPPRPVETLENDRPRRRGTLPSLAACQALPFTLGTPPLAAGAAAQSSSIALLFVTLELLLALAARHQGWVAAGPC